MHRILLVIDHLGMGGAQRQMANLAVGLSERRHEVKLALYYPDRQQLRGRLQAAGVVVHELRKLARYSPALPVRLAALLRRGEFDACISYLDTPNVYAELAGILSRNTLIIATERIDYGTSKLPLPVRVRSQLHRLADYVVTNSQTHATEMIEAYPWIRERIRVIHNGVDTEAFAPPKETGHHDHRHPRLLALGTLVRKKNAHGLIEAVALCRDQMRLRVQVEWAGRVDDTPAARSYRESLQARVEALRLEDQWRFLGACDDVPNRLRTCTALVHPAFRKGLPNAVCEALACGKAVLASNAGDNVTLVGESRGRCFEPGDPRSSADSIAWLAELDDGQYRSLGVEARSYAVKALSLERMVSDYEGLMQ